MSGRRASAVVGLVGGVAGATAAMRAAERLPIRFRRAWARTNHAGADVTLLEGPAWIIGSVGAVIAAAAVDHRSARPAPALAAAAQPGVPAAAQPGVPAAAQPGVAAAAPVGVPAAAHRRAAPADRRGVRATAHRPVAGAALPHVVVALGSGALGALDDLAGTTESKGLTGHLTALARGEVTTGAIKIVGLALTGLAAVALADWAGGATTPRPTTARDATLRATTPRGASRRDAACRDGAPSAGGRRHSVLETFVGGAVVAGTANAVNLFDLRPGRALKVAMAVSGPLVLRGSSSAASAVGASLGVLAPDLAGRAMLGDTGANAAGAVVGLAVVERCGLAGRTLALAVLTGLTLASERVSFTRVIEGNAVLRRLDEWGRSPR